MNTTNECQVSYGTMIVLAVIAGGWGIALQLMPDGEILAFLLSLAALGGLISGSNTYSARDRQLLRQSYKRAYEWLLLTIMTACAFILFSRWLNIIEGVAIFFKTCTKSHTFSVDIFP